MAKIKSTVNEQINFRREKDPNVRADLFISMLKRSTLHELREFVDYELSLFDDNLLDWLVECVVLCEKYSTSVNDILVDFNTRLANHSIRVETKEDIDNVKDYIIEKLNKGLLMFTSTNSLESMLNDMLGKIYLNINHVCILCRISATKGDSVYFKRRERYLVHLMLSKLDYWGEYIVDMFSSINDFLLNYITNTLEQELKNNEYKKEMNKFKRDLNRTIKDTKVRCSNLYRSRELNNLAKSCGYKKIRQKGDHGVYKKENGEVVVIPQRTYLGKGLSCKIQKNVLTSTM